MLQAIQKDGHVKPCMSGKGFWYFIIITYDIQDRALSTKTKVEISVQRRVCIFIYKIILKILYDQRSSTSFRLTQAILHLCWLALCFTLLRLCGLLTAVPLFSSSPLLFPFFHTRNIVQRVYSPSARTADTYI